MKGQPVQPVQVRHKEVSVHLDSYPGDGEGDRTVEALGKWVRQGRIGKYVGRNASEA